MNEPPSYNSKIIAHTISALGNDIITYEICMPKWLVAEFNTHKVEIERNSASSRAVPTRIILDMVQQYPVLTLDWRINARGMSTQLTMTNNDSYECDKIWLEARDAMLPFVQRLLDLKADKQRVNRLLESWMWTVIVCTMTGGGGIGINNFFGLRDSELAQPEFKHIAHMMHEQYHNSEPQLSDWHLPYIDWDEVTCLEDNVWEVNGIVYDNEHKFYTEMALRSSARCGRVTHYRQGMDYTLEEDIGRALSFQRDGHYSPLRHASRAGVNTWYGNMYGWLSLSKLIADEGRDYMTLCCERGTDATTSNL